MATLGQSQAKAASSWMSADSDRSGVVLTGQPRFRTRSWSDATRYFPGWPYRIAILVILLPHPRHIKIVRSQLVHLHVVIQATIVSLLRQRPFIYHYVLSTIMMLFSLGCKYTGNTRARVRLLQKKKNPTHSIVNQTFPRIRRINKLIVNVLN